MEKLLVALQVVTNLETGRNVQSLFDDRAANLCARADGHIREKNRFLDEGVLLDGHAGGEDALDNGTATNDTARRHDGIDCGPLMRITVAGEEPCGRLVPVERADGPVVVVEVERRVLGAEVHVRLEEGVERTHVAPIALGGCLFAAHDVRVEVVHVDGVVLVQTRNDVLAEVGRAFVRALQEFAHQELAREDVVAHAREAPARMARHFFGVLGLFLESDHAVVLVHLDDAELARVLDGDGDCRNRKECCATQVEVNHLVDIHLVDVVAAEDGYEVRAFVRNQVDVLEDGVGGALVPVVASAHLCRHQIHVLVEARVQVPCGGDMLVQRVALELRQDLDLEDARVDEVVQNEIDDAVGSAEMHGRLGAVAGEGLQTASLSACHDHAKDVFLMFSRIRPTHKTSVRA